MTTDSVRAGGSGKSPGPQAAAARCHGSPPSGRARASLNLHKSFDGRTERDLHRTHAPRRCRRALRALDHIDKRPPPAEHDGIFWHDRDSSCFADWQPHAGKHASLEHGHSVDDLIIERDFDGKTSTQEVSLGHDPRHLTDPGFLGSGIELETYVFPRLEKADGELWHLGHDFDPLEFGHGTLTLDFKQPPEKLRDGLPL